MTKKQQKPQPKEEKKSMVEKLKFLGHLMTSKKTNPENNTVLR
jgi:hypothetical protein